MLVFLREPYKVQHNVSNHDDFNDVASHLIIDSTVNSPSLGLHGYDKGQESSELVRALNDFWQQESLGLHEHPNDKQDEKKASRDLDITFNGTRYEISLPWKDGKSLFDF